MKYLSLFSGVEAASLAWAPLGWEPVAFAEFDAFPSAVLAHRFPNVPNLGDVTLIDGKKYRGTVDLIVGGSPCQGFSVAGKQKGLEDPRSKLALAYVRLLDEVHPRWFVWENVPGVLSTRGGADFREFMCAITRLGYKCAWRILDAQYVRIDGYPRAIPQRRRRIFVVGHLDGWRYPAEVLFEREGVRGDSETGGSERGGAAGPSEARSRVAVFRSDGFGKFTEDDKADPVKTTNQFNGGSETLVMDMAHANHVIRTYKDVVPTLMSRMGTGGNQVPLVYALAENTIGRQPQNGGGGPGFSEGVCYTLNTVGVHGVTDRMRVRRLTPLECERLMGFPDDYTKVPYRGKPTEACPDAPRYKACGNSMCVNVMRWLGWRIQQIEEHGLSYD